MSKTASEAGRPRVNVRVRRQKVVLEAGALQSAIFNSANFTSIATDAKGVIQIFNVGAERMLGYTAAEVMNKITPANISDPLEVVERAKTLSIELETNITPGFEALASRPADHGDGRYEPEVHEQPCVRIGAEFGKGSAPWHQDTAKRVLQIAWNGFQIRVAVAFRNHRHQVPGVKAPRQPHEQAALVNGQSASGLPNPCIRLLAAHGVSSTKSADARGASRRSHDPTACPRRSTRAGCKADRSRRPS